MHHSDIFYKKRLCKIWAFTRFWAYLRWGYFWFLDLCSLANQKSHNSRNCKNIDIKLGAVSKFDMERKIASDQFRTYEQFWAFWKHDSARMVYNTYNLIESNPLYNKNWKQNQKTYMASLILLLLVNVLILLIVATFQ